jgi:hypothetical protein
MSGVEPGEDVTGRWHGFYSYAGGADTCAFAADLREHGGDIVRIAFEVAQFGPSPGATLSASLEGRRIGRAVDFAKTYDEVAVAHYSIHYAGTLLDGGNEIEGSWSIPGDRSGTFLMVRDGGAEAAKARQEAAEARR